MITKRDGRQVQYDRSKIENAVRAACLDVGLSEDESADVGVLVADGFEEYGYDKNDMTVEEVQDIVETLLMEESYTEVAKAYILYRYEHTLRRQQRTDEEILSMVGNQNDYWATENSNKNSKWVTTQRDYMAGIVSTDIARNFIFPKECIDAHDKGIIHIHDMDYMAQSTLSNCSLINLEDMLQNGTVVNGVQIDKPHRLSTAMTIATQIIAAVASSQYGGCTITLTHLAPFVRLSYLQFYDKYVNWGFSDKEAEKYAQVDLKKEVADAVQTLNYQLNSLTTTNGQAPFISVTMYLGETEEYKPELAMLIEEVLRQRIRGMKNRVGVYVTVAFPKLLYVLEEDNIRHDSKYWYLTQLAAKCTAKRMVPDYISEKKMKEIKDGDCFPCMGCRSFLTPDRFTETLGNIANAGNYDGKPKYYGRFNVGVTTINLVDAALSAKKICEDEGLSVTQENLEKYFWPLMEGRTELCHKVQQIRAERISKTKAEVAPILWCDGAFARLDKDDTLDKLVHNGYATSSIGFAGLYECVKVVTGESHTQKNGKEFGLRVMRFLNAQCDKWKAEENIDYSIYGSPIESTTYTFQKGLHKRFGTVEGITDRDYITNSYHVPVFEKISIFDKFALESEFQNLAPGGAISYGEGCDLTNNLEVVEAVIQYIYDTIMYAELNFKSDYCQECGYDGEIELKYDEKARKHYYQCPNCGNLDTDKMNIARRVCGYISTTVPNEGRLGDIADRYVHIDDHELGE